MGTIILITKPKSTLNPKPVSEKKLNNDDFLEEINLLREAKIPFSFEVNNHTYRIKSELGKYFITDNTIPMRELGFVRRVKDYVLANKIHKRIPNDFPKNRDGTRNHTMIKYFDYYKPRKSTVYTKELFEIDINQAYWDTSKMDGILSEELYQEGLTVNKNTRLAALGSLAKRTEIWDFDGTEMKYVKTLKKKTEHLWFKICEHLGNVMFKAAKAAGKFNQKEYGGFLMYWVDGIYVQGMDAVVRVCQSLEADGYQYKVRRINKIEVKLQENEIWVHDDIDGDRMFNIGEPKFKEYFRKQAKKKKQLESLNKKPMSATRKKRLKSLQEVAVLHGANRKLKHNH